jgi:DNA-binding beta-propeller fold protein YncE
MDARTAEFLGRPCLTGTAFLRNTRIENGIIEFDMAVTGQRSYPGVLFHISSPEDYERIYLRPHLPPLFRNVVQYVSTFNDIDSWQLYSGPGYTASAEIPKNEWFHVKIEIKGKQARMFLNQGNIPVLEIAQLEHGSRSGLVGVSGAGDGTAYFSNFSCREDNNLSFLPDKEAKTPYGVITDWQLSPVYKLSEVDNEMTPETQGITGISWKNVQSRTDGIVDISRFYSRYGNAPDIIFAKTVIESRQDEQKLFSFGYSDFISVFLNGKLLFAGNSSYTSRDPSFQGIVGLNDYISLPLKKGKNELMITLAENFGGWGFIFRDAKARYQDRNLVTRWEKKHKLKYPESVTYDKKRDLIYVSNYFNDGKEFISKITPNGEIVSNEWVGGIMQPTGLCMSGDKLYVVGRMALVEIDPDQGKIINRFRFPDPGMPNDVAGDDEGNLFITDSQKNLIYRLSDGKLEVWLKSDEIPKPNGILAENGKLLVGTSGDGCIKMIDLNTRSVSTMACIGEGSIMDGITPDGQGNYLVSDYNGRIFRIDKAGGKTLLLDTTAPSQPCADFEYIPEKKLVIVPTLSDNRLVAYEITDSVK